MMIADDAREARDAWELHHKDGLAWSQVAKELGYSDVGVVRKLAAAYQERTDAAAAEHQIALF